MRFFLTLIFDVSRFSRFIATCRITPTLYDLIPTQAKRNLSSRSGIGGVLSAT